METHFKIIIISILIIVFLLIGIYLYLVRIGVLRKELKTPNYEIPITYNIGWWSYQKGLTIDEFDIKIKESNLNLFNSKSLISYKIKGKIKHKQEWKPEIKEVHISERINKDTTQNYSRIIEITPVVKVVNDRNLKKGVKKFEFKNEHIITSANWGDNYILFKCYDKEKIIMLCQKK